VKTIYKSERWTILDGHWVLQMSKADDIAYYALCEGIGSVLINWALLDQQLDIWADQIFKKFSWPTKSVELPKGLDRRTKFLKQAFREVAVLTPLGVEAREIMRRMAISTGTRDALVHGVILDMKHKKGVWIFQKLDIKASKHEVRKEKVTIQSLSGLLAECLYLGAEAMKLTKQIGHFR